MKRFTPATLGSWGYQTGLCLYGQYLVCKRTHDKTCLDYIKAWVDRFVDTAGKVNNSFSSLDSTQSGTLLVLLYQETKDPRCQKAAAQIRTADFGK